MPFFKSRSQKEKDVKCLVGSVDNLTEEERMLYNLSAVCLHSSSDKSVAFDNFSGEEPTSANMLDSKQIQTADSSHQLFQPRFPLPPLIYRQTFSMWKAGMDINFRFWRLRKRKTIYIQPLDSFPDFITEFSYSGKLGFFDLLQKFMEIFFMGCAVRLLPVIDTSDWNITSRYHKTTKKRQYLVTDINERLKQHIPADGFCLLGMTWTDLYPSEDMNFVLGEASAKLCTATFCFGHYEPKSYCEGKKPIETLDGSILWRMLKVISHETCHIFNLTHCQFFHCAMNESDSMLKALSQPLFLCPVCLRKIQKVCGFRVRERYATLLVFLKELNCHYSTSYLQMAIDWLERCLLYMTSGASEAKDDR